MSSRRVEFAAGLGELWIPFLLPHTTLAPRLQASNSMAVPGEQPTAEAKRRNRAR